MKSAPIVCLFLTLYLVGASGAQTNSHDVARIAPFVNTFTLGVVRVEPGGIDFDALQRWGDDVIKRSNMDADDARLATEGLQQAVQDARKWAGQFTRAGGKAVWVVVTVENFPDDPFFVVVPLENGADGQALQKLLTSGAGQNAGTVVQSKGALILASSAKAAERVRAIMSQPRPELAKAMAEAGDAKLRIALIPSDDSRRVIESMMPRLPNGVSSESLTKGMLWAAVTVTPPTNVTVHGIVQSENNSAAQAFHQLLVEFAPAGQQVKARSSGESLLQVLGEIAAGSQVKGDRVAIDLNEDQTKSAASHLAGALRRARVQANRVRSASNMRQILIGCAMYANNHYDKARKIGPFPDNLNQLMKDQEMSPAVFVNPSNPTEKTGYVYIKPPEGSSAPADRIVLYEKYTKWDTGINVGFADGHTEFWANQRGAEKMIQDAVSAQKK